MRCIVCEVLLPNKAATLRRYCKGCAPYVKQLQADVAMILDFMEVPAASGYCGDCGKAAKHRDHRLYARPLDVAHVCSGCNQKRGPALDVAEMVRARLPANAFKVTTKPVPLLMLSAI